jgi:putative polyhydroxyalkanoate system protein
MAAIRINQPHALPLAQAREAAETMAQRMAKEFGVSYAWEGDALKFAQTGVSGALALADGEARFEMELAGMMSAFAPMIEEKLTRKMREIFGG